LERPRGVNPPDPAVTFQAENWRKSAPTFFRNSGVGGTGG
jgi:hypothetical protein